MSLFLTIEQYHNPNEGRDKINYNFLLLSAFTGIFGISGTTHMFTAGTGTSAIQPVNGLNNSSGNYAFTVGQGNEASGNYAISMGLSNTGTTNGSLAIGNSNKSTGAYGIAIGQSNTASTNNAVSIGGNNEAAGLFSLAFGDNNISSNSYSHSIGRNNSCLGTYALAMGFLSTAVTTSSIAIGVGNLANSLYSTAIGFNNLVRGDYSLAVGRINTVAGYGSVVFGDTNQSFSAGTFIVGTSNSAITSYNYVFGESVKTYRENEFAVGKRVHTSAAVASSYGTILMFREFSGSGTFELYTNPSTSGVCSIDTNINGIYDIKIKVNTTILAGPSKGSFSSKEFNYILKNQSGTITALLSGGTTDNYTDSTLSGITYTSSVDNTTDKLKIEINNTVNYTTGTIFAFAKMDYQFNPF